jgi:uroporphyrinogen-III synthase
MRVVITRPQPASERTAAALAARGHDVWEVPLMRIEPIEADLSGTWGAVVITSANAPGAIAGNPAFAALLELPVYAVGRRSAEAAQQAGFAYVTSAGGDVRDLVQLIAERHADAKAPLLYLAGEDRAADLVGELASHAIAAQMRVVYRAVTAPFPDELVATCRRYCISPSAAPRITWPARARLASPSRPWTCGIIACRRRWPRRSTLPAPSASPSRRARKRRR